MSLIDTQVVVNLIADIQYDDRYINNNEVFVALETVRDCVFNLPTAYDVDRVVEELKESATYDTYWDDGGCSIDIDDAIEIVRRGGTNGQ